MPHKNARRTQRCTQWNVLAVSDGTSWDRGWAMTCILSQRQGSRRREMAQMTVGNF